MNTNHRPASPFLVTALFLLSVTVPLRAGDLQDLARILDKQQVTARMDLPVVRSLYVDLDGRFDEKRYYERIRKFPARLLRGDRAEITRVEIERDRVGICLNRCGLPGFAVGRTTRGGSGGKKTGARIEVELGGRSPSSVRAEEVLAALANVVELPSSILPPSAPATTASPVQPTAELLSAEAAPTTISPGAPIELVAHFEVGGAQTPVTLERQLLREGSPLLDEPRTTTESFAPGRHSSRMKLTVPASADPGVYTLRVTLRAAGTEATREALFVVTR
jgi:hypothetical protein